MRKVQEPLPWFHTSAVMNYDGLETNGVTSGATNGATNGVTIVAMVSIASFCTLMVLQILCQFVWHRCHGKTGNYYNP